MKKTMKQLVILAGGKGTRLKDRLHSLPKPLIDISGKPLLLRQIELTKAHGFFDIFITIHYEAQAIKQFCGDGSEWGVTIRYIEEVEPQGTAGAILTQLDQFDETFLIMYGDTMLNVDLDYFWNMHQKNQADATLFLHPNDHPHDSDLVEIEESGRVITFYPYPHSSDRFYPNLVNAALYVIQKNALRPWQYLTGSIDFGKNLFPWMLQNKQYIHGYNSAEYIKDIGTPARLDKVNSDFQSGKIERGSRLTPTPTIFLDRDGTINEEIGYLTKPEQLILIEHAASAIKRFNQNNLRTVVVTNQPVIARGICDVSQLKEIHNKLETELGKEGAYLNAIYYCPHHPDNGFQGERKDLKILCGCRKPAQQLLQRAQLAAPIDMANSWFIGDTSVDMETAHKAGLKSILVRTGFSGCDDKYPARPDFECFNLGDAAHFILDCFPPMMNEARTLTHNIQPGQRVTLGGLARSGKSSWASAMRYALLERHIQTTIISLDGFLKNSDARGKGNVLTRYDLDGIADLLATLDNITESIQVPLYSYNRLQRRRNTQVNTVTITPEHVIIFEGVIALTIEKLRHTASHLFFMNCPEAARKENFRKEYTIRGLSEIEIETLYEERHRDETHIITAHQSHPEIIHIQNSQKVLL